MSTLYQHPTTRQAIEALRHFATLLEDGKAELEESTVHTKTTLINMTTHESTDQVFTAGDTRLTITTRVRLYNAGHGLQDDSTKH